MTKLLISFALFLSACGEGAGAVLIPTTHEVACETGRCLDIEVVNQGPAPGGGTCSIAVVGQDKKLRNSEEPAIDVPELEPQEAATFSWPITMSERRLRQVLEWSTSCDPGPEG